MIRSTTWTASVSSRSGPPGSRVCSLCLSACVRAHDRVPTFRRSLRFFRKKLLVRVPLACPTAPARCLRDCCTARADESPHHGAEFAFRSTSRVSNRAQPHRTAVIESGWAGDSRCAGSTRSARCVSASSPLPSLPPVPHFALRSFSPYEVEDESPMESGKSG